MNILQSNAYYVKTYPSIYQEGYEQPTITCPYPKPINSQAVTIDQEKALAYRIGQCDRQIADLCKDQLVCHYTGPRPNRFVEENLASKHDAYNLQSPFNIKFTQYSQQLIDMLLYNRYMVHITGGALGFDQRIGTLLNSIRMLDSYIVVVYNEDGSVRDKRTINPKDLVHIVAVPCQGQDMKWLQPSKNMYQQMLKQASVVYYCDRRLYTHECMQYRNEWMTDYSELTATAFIRSVSEGGTYNNLAYALSKNRPILGFDPKTWEFFDHLELIGQSHFPYITIGQYYKEVEGDIFSTEADGYMNTTNAKGVMGKGLALAFKTHFASEHLEQQYKQACMKGLVQPGQCVVQKLNEGKTYVLNCVVKDDWKNPSTVEWIEQSLQQLCEYVQQTPSIRSINASWPGRKNGWIQDYEKRVVPLVRKYLGELANTQKIQVTVYYLES